MIRGLPSELLGGLVRERLRTLGVEGTEVHVDERPGIGPRQLGTESVDVVVIPVDGNDVAAVYRRRDDLALLEIGRNEHEGAQTGVGSVRGDSVREVAGGCARGDLEPELECLAQRDRSDPVLERVGGVGGVVLDPDLTEAQLGREPIGTDQRREPGAEVDRRIAVQGQQIRVPPDAERPGGDRFAGDRRLDRVVVVGHLERAETPLTREDRGDVVFTTALPTAQSMHLGHGSSLLVSVARRALARTSRSSVRALNERETRSVTHALGSLIVRALAPGSPQHWVRWLPRRLRARPSTALDKRVNQRG